MWRSIVLQAAIARQSALAARAWEDFGSTIAEEGSQEPDSCNSQLGDTFHAASEILLPLDVVWLALAVLAVLLVLVCTQQLGLHVDGSSGPEKFPGTQWYRAGFSSLTSHAAGIVGFVGFQKIVVARIVALSDTCHLWSLHNFLLYTTLALSVVAVSASFVFLGVDYARRLAIDAAKQKGFRLVLKAKKLENTGIGLAIIALGGLMVLLYVLVILKEASQQKVKHIDHKWLLLDTVCGGGTVLLFYLNLRGLYQSPKVQFDATCHEADERITLEDFLEMHSVTVREGPGSLATVLERVAGEDLALLATRGTRRAILPSQRWAPLVHVICGLLLLGAFPLVVHLGANSLFAKPKLEDLKALTGTVVEISESSDGSNLWFWNAPASKRFLFLNSQAAKLQVTPTYQQTSRIELCCPSLPTDCERERLNHSLIKFFKEPVVLSVPYSSNSPADCNLILHGLSSRSETTVAIRIEPKVQHHLCDCSLEVCSCCGGFHGELNFSNLSKNLSKLGLKQSSELLRNVCKNASCESVNNTNGKNGNECACKEGYVGEISWNGSDPKGICTAAECNFHGSNGVSGPDCDCDDGFEGKPHWNNGTWTENCHPAECNFNGSNNLSGPDCGCAEGFEGKPHWNNGTWTGNCRPAECNFDGSNNFSGPHCGCADGFEGIVYWNLNGSWKGNCRPAECAVANSTGQGQQCLCKNGFQGSIAWRGPHANGSCEPASCDSISDSMGNGTDCRCVTGFAGEISWKGATLIGNCTPAPCEIQNSNGQPGPSCKCKDGFVGDITWSGSVAQGHCEPAPCNVENSTKAPGLQCECVKNVTRRSG